MFEGLWQALTAVLRAVFFYAWDWVTGYGTLMLAELLDMAVICLPATWTGEGDGSIAESFAIVGNMLRVANAWVPIDYFVTLILCYWAGVLLIYSVRHIIKFIPMVG